MAAIANELAIDVKATAQAAPFAFDTPYRDVVINATPLDDEPTPVTYRLRKPTETEDREHQKQSAIRNVYGANNNVETEKQNTFANQTFFRKLAQAVKAVDFEDGSNPSEFVELTPARLELLVNAYPDHGDLAINALYQGECVARAKPEQAEAKGPRVLRIKTTNHWFDLRIGPKASPIAEIAIEVQRPSEAAWRAFQTARQLTETESLKGRARGVKQMTVINRAAYRALLNDCVVSFGQATVGERTLAEVAHSPRSRGDWFNAIDGLWCVEIGLAIETEFSAGLSD